MDRNDSFRDEDFRKENEELSRAFLPRYGCAFISIALSTGLRLLVDPVVGDQSPYMLYLFAILFTAWYGGFRPALLAVAIGAVAANFFFVHPRGNFGYNGALDIVNLAIYLGAGLGIAVLGGEMQAGSHRNIRRILKGRQALVQADELLRLTLGSAGIAVWSWDPVRNIIKMDDNGAICSASSPASSPSHLKVRWRWCTLKTANVFNQN